MISYMTDVMNWDNEELDLSSEDMIYLSETLDFHMTQFSAILNFV